MFEYIFLSQFYNGQSHNTARQLQDANHSIWWQSCGNIVDGVETLPGQVYIPVNPTVTPLSVTVADANSNILVTLVYSFRKT